MRNGIIKGLAKDHIELLQGIDSLKAAPGPVVEQARITQDLEDIASSIRANYDDKNIEVEAVYKKIKFLVENLNMNIEESIGDFERSSNVLSTRKLENLN